MGLTGALAALERACDNAAPGAGQPSWLYPARRIASSGQRLVKDITTWSQALEGSGQQHDQRGESDHADRPGGASATGASGSGLRGKLQPTTIQALQATVAGAISIGLGCLLSPAHQYWTVLAAFVVLSNTGSIGKVYTRALQRVGGTLLGAIVGFGLAALVAGSTRVEIVLAFVCVFFAFYLFSLSYGLMVFWVTVMLALMYDVLLGGVNAGLLQTRFVDTLIGAAVSLVMSVVILPTRTSDEVKTSVRGFLTSLNEYVGRYLDQLDDEDEGGGPIGDAFDLSEKLQAVTSATDTVRKVSGTRARWGTERIVTTLVAVNYYAGQLTDPSSRALALERDQQTALALQDVKEGITANVDALIDRVDGTNKATSVRSLESLEDLIESRLDVPRSATSPRSLGEHDHERAGAAGPVSVDAAERGSLVRALHYIWHINQAIVDLAVDLGASREDNANSP